MSASFEQPHQKAPEPSRDRFGRPLVKPPGGGEAIAYTRVSTLAKALDDMNGLMAWQSRMTARGMAMRPDLIALAAATDPSETKTYSGIVKDALAAAQAGAAANRGSALHAFTDHVDAGRDLSLMPADIAPDIYAYKTAITMGQLRPTLAETFVVIDELQVAGSFDRIFALPDNRLLLSDTKTGKDAPKYATALAVQLACYSRGEIYNIETGERSALPPVDQATGLLVHLQAGKGKCAVHTVDLVKGWQAAQVAAWVRDWRKDRTITSLWFETP